MFSWWRVRKNKWSVKTLFQSNHDCFLIVKTFFRKLYLMIHVLSLNLTTVVGLNNYLKGRKKDKKEETGRYNQLKRLMNSRKFLRLVKLPSRRWTNLDLINISRSRVTYGKWLPRVFHASVRARVQKYFSYLAMFFECFRFQWLTVELVKKKLSLKSRISQVRKVTARVIMQSLVNKLTKENHREEV